MYVPLYNAVSLDSGDPGRRVWKVGVGVESGESGVFH